MLATNQHNPEIIAKTRKTEPELIKVTPDLYQVLERTLNLQSSNDPFLKSIAYFVLTGRKGLWIFRNNFSFTFICHHPNLSNTVLIFPPIGKHPEILIQQALNCRFFNKKKIQLSRLCPKSISYAKKLEKDGIGKIDDEYVLDWLYPVHILSTQKIIRRNGKEFNSFRGHVNRAVRNGYTFEPIRIEEHEEKLLIILDQWVNTTKKSGYTRDDLEGPTRFLIECFKTKSININGIVVFDVNKRPLGFWILDISNKQYAISLVRVSVGQNGAAEFGALKTCEHLDHMKIPYICTGGSETESLDKFKRKMCPVESIELKSFYFYDNVA